jgi:hypothetical protein
MNQLVGMVDLMGNCSTPVFMCFYLKWSLLMDPLEDIRGILHCLGDEVCAKIIFGFGLKSLTSRIADVRPIREHVPVNLFHFRCIKDFKH